MSDPNHTQEPTESSGSDTDTASDDGLDASTREMLDDETTDDDGTPVENPSGG